MPYNFAKISEWVPVLFRRLTLHLNATPTGIEQSGLCEPLLTSSTGQYCQYQYNNIRVVYSPEQTGGLLCDCKRSPLQSSHLPFCAVFALPISRKIVPMSFKTSTYLPEIHTSSPRRDVL